jgi:hypothetical protein
LTIFVYRHNCYYGDDESNISSKELVIASFFCANISTVNLILRRLESYDGVIKVEPITIASETRVYQDWLKSVIDKRIASSQKYSSLSATAAAAATLTED